jgi:hypothetical protein
MENLPKAMPRTTINASNDKARKWRVGWREYQNLFHFKKSPLVFRSNTSHFPAVTRLHDNTGVGGNTLKKVHISRAPIIYDDGITYRPKLSSLLTDGAGNSGTLHFTLGIDDLTEYVLDNFHPNGLDKLMAEIREA